LKQEEIQRFGATTIVARQAFRPAISDIWRSQARSVLARRADALISNETAGYAAVMVAVPQAKFFEGVAEAHCLQSISLCWRRQFGTRRQFSSGVKTFSTAL
jgi:hypothetical protein